MRSMLQCNVIITGASSGIGEACAHAFAKLGCNLLLIARRQSRLEKLKLELEKTFSIRVAILAADVRDHQTIRDYIQHYNQSHSIDILINNAGLALGRDKFQDADPATFDAVVDTNIKALLQITSAVLPGMLKNNSGHIINISSIAGHETYTGGTVYAATKHAVRAINAGLKKDLHGTAIRVTSIDPGMVETEFSLVRFGGDETLAKSVYRGMQPLTAADIADCIVFAATRAPHINISEIKLYPTDQSSAEMVHRKE